MIRKQKRRQEICGRPELNLIASFSKGVPLISPLKVGGYVSDKLVHLLVVVDLLVHNEYYQEPEQGLNKIQMKEEGKALQ